MPANILVTTRRMMKDIFKTFWRNRVSTIIYLCSLVVLFSFIHILSLGNEIGKMVVQNVEKKVDIPVFIHRGASESSIDVWKAALDQKKKEGIIREYTEISREESLLDFQKKYPEKIEFIERYGLENPLLTVFALIPENGAENISTIETWILSSQWRETLDQKAFRQANKTIAQAKQFLHMSEKILRGLFILQIVFFGISILLLSSFLVVMIRSHTKEISIMRLVGARKGMIRFPFYGESLLLTGGALGISVGIILLLTRIFSEWVLSASAEIYISDGVLTEFLNQENIQEIVFQNSYILFGVSFLVSALCTEYILRHQEQ